MSDRYVAGDVSQQHTKAGNEHQALPADDRGADRAPSAHHRVGDLAVGKAKMDGKHQEGQYNKVQQ